ncbi:hypothetical protein ANO11243_008360 [Dothideomycetidae sp. 11243]|nr:hypothetical protein ANO11243_008360 [fungal sp. No.11243]
MRLFDKTNGYTTLDGKYVDAEKRQSFDDTDSEASFSSGDGSGSHMGLLSQELSPPRRGRVSFSYGLRRRRISRYFSVAIAAGLIVLVLYLTHQKALSEAEVQLNSKGPPPSPRPWEEFPFLTRYHGGVRSIVPLEANEPEYPDPARELEIGKEAMENQTDPLGTRSVEFDTEAYNPFLDTTDRKKCFLDLEERVAIPALHIHRGVPSGMPDPVIGSYEVLGLQNPGCFDRYGRLGPYGLGYSRKYGGTGTGIEGDGREEAMERVWNASLEIDYSKVNWADAQSRCAHKNRDRFQLSDHGEDRVLPVPTQMKSSEESSDLTKNLAEREVTSTRNEKLTRTAVLIRTWHDFQYDAEDILYLRALINELSLQSGGEYTVHFLVHVKDDNLQIWADEEIYQQTLDNALPAEFKGMGTLWSERQMGLIYGGIADSMFRDLPVHGVYRSAYMPVQYFARSHPEYDFFWHWEMDVRYIGHYYHLFNRLSSWSKDQPRKGLWERNGRFYVPSEHGSWEDFSHMVRVQTEHGTGSRANMYQKMAKDPKHPDDMQSRPEKPIWGPLRHQESDHFEIEKDPQPPTAYAEDKYVWGVGEEADFITLNPLFDPDQTGWIVAEDVTGYNTSEGQPPRRAAVVTTSRLSRRLLEVMHRETALARHTMFSEMWPATCALHHGLKAVYAPHPVYIDRRWPTSYLAAIFNNGRNGASGGARGSVFSEDRQHNFLGTTWYYHAGFPGNLWKRWLGYKVDNDGGEEEERAGEGRMCLPSMLLHPVKHVDMIYEPKEEVRNSTAEGDQAS